MERLFLHAKLNYKNRFTFVKVGMMLFLNICFCSIYGQYKNKIIAKSNSVHIETKPITKDDKYNAHVNLPVIRLIDIESADNKPITLQSNKPTFNLKGFTYSRDGSTIEKLLINGFSVTLKDDDYFEKLLFLGLGKNVIKIQVYTSSKLISAETITINFERTKSKKYILSIAIDNYTNFQQLHYPVQNSKDIIKTLEEKYGYSSSEIIELYNERATSEILFNEFYKLIDSIKPEDKLIIFYAGHGFYDNQTNEGYWVPYNAKERKPNEYISNSSIINFIKAIKSKHTLLICDACFSGSLFETQARGENINYVNFEKRQSRWAFTSGMVEEVTDESLFTKYMIKYLQENTKPKLLLSELADFVIKSVSLNSDQMPKLGPLRSVDHQGGEYVFRLFNSSSLEELDD